MPNVMDELTYVAIGTTLGAQGMPPGYRHIARRIRVGHGQAAFDALADGILRWGIQRRAGLEVRSASERAAVGVDVTCVARVGPLRVAAPCRVVGVVDEPGRRAGFAYGTLPGHPECGEEAFLAEAGGDGDVWFVVRAFSRAGVWWSKVGAPVARVVQRRVTDRYLRAGEALVHSRP
jgi:uncharacterized protein (UPF0548 family)